MVFGTVRIHPDLLLFLFVVFNSSGEKQRRQQEQQVLHYHQNIVQVQSFTDVQDIVRFLLVVLTVRTGGARFSTVRNVDVKKQQQSCWGCRLRNDTDYNVSLLCN